jgi:hypothetical protein
MPIDSKTTQDESWGLLSEGWPQTDDDARGKFIFANISKIIPYGSYVINGNILRVENITLLNLLNNNYSVVRKYFYDKFY